MKKDFENEENYTELEKTLVISPKKRYDMKELLTKRCGS